jgi:hypothetical protein
MSTDKRFSSLIFRLVICDWPASFTFDRCVCKVIGDWRNLCQGWRDIEVLAPVIQTSVLWYVASCRLVEMFQRLVETCLDEQEAQTNPPKRSEVELRASSSSLSYTISTVTTRVAGGCSWFDVLANGLTAFVVNIRSLLRVEGTPVG